MHELVLPTDEKSYAHILIAYGENGKLLTLRYDYISMVHAQIAENFAVLTLGASYEEILASNYLMNELRGHKVVGAGEFELIRGTFYHRPKSQYNTNCLNLLRELLNPLNIAVEVVNDLP